MRLPVETSTAVAVVPHWHGAALVLAVPPMRPSMRAFASQPDYPDCMVVVEDEDTPLLGARLPPPIKQALARGSVAAMWFTSLSEALRWNLKVRVMVMRGDA